MRTIFFTPLLFKKIDRSAIRRGEEGQAIVLVALVAVGMVAMVGLAIDGGLGYLDATRLQRAADAAALAGVIWLPDNRSVGDARAQLAAEANGIKVACYYDTGQASTTAYNQRCKRASYTTVTQNAPDTYYSFDSEVPTGIAILYRVTLSKMENRFFLGILGFPSYPIVRTSTAEYFHRVKFGSSFNYYGSNGVLEDHYMRCDQTTMANCDGNTVLDLNMRGATYQKYVLMRCEQNSPPSPCIGGFWGHMGGEDILHTNGDAYNPIRDGGDQYSTGSAGVNGLSISDKATGSQANCLHVNDPTTWFVTNIFYAGSGNNCPAYNASTTPPIINGDIHPDSPNGQRSFGSEIIVDVDPAAIWSFADTQANVANHTNLNVTIYDGAENEQGGETFGTSDNYQARGNSYGAVLPYTGWGFMNVTNSNPVTLPTATTSSSSWSTKRLVCSPGTTTLANTSYCDSSSLSTPSYPTAPRATSSNPSQPGDIATFFPDRNNLELTYNDLRTRLTLYGPPPTPAIPSIYQNVLPYKLGQMEITDMSIRGGGVQTPIGCPQGGCGGSDYQRFCYFIFDDTKSFWDNTQFPDTNNEALKSPQYGTGTTTTKYYGPDYAYSSVPTTSTLGTLRSPNNRYAYVCPTSNSGTNYDFRWNQLKGTPTARYGAMVDYDPTNLGDRTIAKEIFDVVSPTTSITPTYDIYLNPIVTGTLSNGANLSQADPKANNANIWDPTSANFSQVVDPNQDCRRAAVDINTSTGASTGFGIDPLWGHNRIPFNMAYGDPLVNRAWITSTTWTTASPTVTMPVATGKIAGYYTLYYSFHGWRCDWDFDSNYTADPIPGIANSFNGRGNPLQNPSKMPSDSNPSLSLKERQTWGSSTGNYGKFDKAFVEGHPGLDSVDYSTKVLLGDMSSSTDCSAFQDFPAYTYTKSGNSCTISSNNAGFSRNFGLEPYFHLTNIAWSADGTTLVANPNLTANTAAVRSGSYMLHVQTFSGAAANRYSLKAEFENPKTITYTIAGGTLSVIPVPSVYPLTAMTIYANALNKTSSQQDVIFDLAFIPPEYAGTQGIVQLFDSGDVSGQLDVSILAPSTYGPRVKTNNAGSPVNASGTYQWSIPLGTALSTSLTACPYNLNQCIYSSIVSQGTVQHLRVGTTSYYNDQWAFLSFQLPSAATYATYKASCEANGVPENLCYYFQIDYILKDAGAQANDTTTWQLLVQGQPVHLVDNQGQP
jgi:Flp pilus assembly protein TadG